MEGKKQERYSLMGPGGGISAISMETGEFHLFGNSCTTIITTETDNYPVIEDEPGKLEVVDNTDLMSGIGHGIANGLLLCAGVVLFAGATAATGGAALLLGGCVLGGASFGVSAATDGMVESDRETGNDRSWGDFALGVAGGGVAGATTGAVLYGTVMAAPVAGLAAGMDAAAVIGPSAFTTTVVPAIITGGGYGLAGATALYVENDIRAKNGGYNLLLDKVFDNNTDRYEECGMILMLGNNVYMEYGAMNMNRMPGGDSKQSLGNNQSVQKLKTQNSQPGTSKGNTGGGGASTGAGGQSQVGVQFGQENETGMVTYRRVQGGTGNKSSQMRITIDSEGNVHISNKNANLNLSIDNGEHSQYYTKYNRPGADIYEFEVPKWFDDMVQEYTIPQTGYQSNPLNQGGSVPKLTDTGTPGTSVEFPSPWIEWIEEYARNGRIRSGGN